MEFPFGQNHSHTHHRRNDDEDSRERPPPPHLHNNEFAPLSHHYPPPPPNYQQPPSFDGPYPPTPYPPAPPSSYFQQPGFDGPSPPHQPPPYFQQPGFPSPPHQPPPYFQQPGFPSPPPPHQPAHVTHVHHSGGSHHQQPEHGFGPHESNQERVDHHHQPLRPNLPPEFHKKPTFKVYCKADPGYHLSIRDGQVILAPSNPSDEFQHWYKDEKFSTRVKDEVGFPSFSLVNKATGQAIKHSIGASHPLQLVPYKPDHLDESVLWSESLEVHDGYRAIRMINNIRLNVDAFHSDKKSGGVRNGTTVGLWQWNKGDNQIWKIAPY